MHGDFHKRCLRGVSNLRAEIPVRERMALVQVDRVVDPDDRTLDRDISVADLLRLYTEAAPTHGAGRVRLP